MFASSYARYFEVFISSDEVFSVTLLIKSTPAPLLGRLKQYEVMLIRSFVYLSVAAYAAFS